MAMRRVRKQAALAVATAVAGWAGLAQAAAMIGIDFSGGTNGNGGQVPIPATTLAGVVPQIHWNNLSATSGSNFSPITDDSGATVSGLKASWGANGSKSFWGYGSNFTAADPNRVGDSDLYSVSLNVPGGGQYHATITVTGIPYATYDVYAYFYGKTGTQSGGLVNLNGTWNGSTVTGGTTFNFSSANVSDFVVATTAGGAANYAKFSNVSGSSLTLTDRTGNNGGLIGIQIVETPEPAMLGLVVASLGGLGMTRRRRARA